MKIRFWGTRGSIPTPGPDTVRYGGNTPCVEVQCDDTLIILDAGSGLRPLGMDLLGRGNGPFKAHLLLSHFHWDHIQGFPFFVPAYIPGNQLTIYGAEGMSRGLEDILNGQMADDYFPIALDEMGSSREYRAINEETFKIDDVYVTSRYVNHPGVALCYRFEYKGRTFCYISDNEPQYYLAKHGQGQEGILDSFKQDIEEREIKMGQLDLDLVEFLKGVDVLVHDCQYTPDEYCMKIGWGHSFFQFPVEVAMLSGVQQLVIFHHDPMHSDEFIDQMLEQAQKIVSERGSEVVCQAAREGMEIEI